MKLIEDERLLIGGVFFELYLIREGKFEILFVFVYKKEYISLYIYEVIMWFVSENCECLGV